MKFTKSNSSKKTKTVLLFKDVGLFLLWGIGAIVAIMLIIGLYAAFKEATPVFFNTLVRFFRDCIVDYQTTFGVIGFGILIIIIIGVIAFLGDFYITFFRKYLSDNAGEGVGIIVLWATLIAVGVAIYAIFHG